MLRSVFRITAVALLPLLQAGVADAGSNTAALPVSAQVLASATCRVVITPVTFGDLKLDETIHLSHGGGVSVVCPDGLNYRIAFNAGEHYDADSGTRQMVSGDYGIAYVLYYGENTQWGDADSYPAGQPVSAVGYSRGTAFNVAGKAFTNAQTPAGNYSDNVLVTVSY